MRLRVIELAETVVDSATEAVSVEGVHGSFTLLPHHIDYVASLTEGFLTYRTTASDPDDPSTVERYVAVDGGVLVKRGADVVVSTPNAVASDRLEELEESVEALFQSRTQHERDARAVLFRIETDVVQRMLELEE